MGGTDPRSTEEELVGILMVQSVPHGHLDFRERFKSVTYAAIIE